MAFTFTAQKLVYGGAALGHYEGRPVLVPRVLPGEQAEVEQLRVAKGVIRAQPLRILEASPERVEPPCPYFGRCGGCHYQHFSAERQVAAKVEILRETLRRIGKIAWDRPILTFSASPWSYRNQAQFKLRRAADGSVEIGFYEQESHRLLAIEACLILSPGLNAVLAELRKPEWSSRLADCREVELLADHHDRKVAVTLRADSPLEAAEGFAKDLLANLPGAVCVAVESGGQWRGFGAPALEYAVGEFRYRVSPGAFFQASRFLLPELVTAVTGAESGCLALDLFAGVGLFTLPLARKFAQVVGVEADVRAAADLMENASRHGFANVQSVAMSVHEFLRRFAQRQPELAVLDPPRTGVDVAALKLLCALRPQRIHYVSCGPPALARDLGYLVVHGYDIISVELFDFFPQTYHLESLVRLERRAS